LVVKRSLLWNFGNRGEKITANLSEISDEQLRNLSD
jgi:hypothetical protein